MNQNASPETVKAYLVKEGGYLPEKAQKMVDRHSEIVSNGQRMMSYAYYTANKVQEAELKFVNDAALAHAKATNDFEFKPAEQLPDDYFDPNWVQPEEEDEDEDSED
jgi:hypothetical protein